MKNLNTLECQNINGGYTNIETAGLAGVGTALAIGVATLASEGASKALTKALMSGLWAAGGTAAVVYGLDFVNGMTKK